MVTQEAMSITAQTGDGMKRKDATRVACAISKASPGVAKSQTHTDSRSIPMEKWQEDDRGRCGPAILAVFLRQNQICRVDQYND